jgi:hypothetical protein
MIDLLVHGKRKMIDVSILNPPLRRKPVSGTGVDNWIPAFARMKRTGYGIFEATLSI